MTEIQLVKIPNKKRTAICVYDPETNITHIIGYVNKEENIDLFLEALTNYTYVLNIKNT